MYRTFFSIRELTISIVMAFTLSSCFLNKNEPIKNNKINPTSSNKKATTAEHEYSINSLKIQLPASWRKTSLANLDNNLYREKIKNNQKVHHILFTRSGLILDSNNEFKTSEDADQLEITLLETETETVTLEKTINLMSLILGYTAMQDDFFNILTSEKFYFFDQRSFFDLETQTEYLAVHLKNNEQSKKTGTEKKISIYQTANHLLIIKQISNAKDGSLQEAHKSIHQFLSQLKDSNRKNFDRVYSHKDLFNTLYSFRDRYQPNQFPNYFYLPENISAAALEDYKFCSFTHSVLLNSSFSITPVSRVEINNLSNFETISGLDLVNLKIKFESLPMRINETGKSETFCWGVEIQEKNANRPPSELLLTFSPIKQPEIQPNSLALNDFKTNSLATDQLLMSYSPFKNPTNQYQLMRGNQLILSFLHHREFPVYQITQSNSANQNLSSILTPGALTIKNSNQLNYKLNIAAIFFSNIMVKLTQANQEKSYYACLDLKAFAEDSKSNSTGDKISNEVVYDKMIFVNCNFPLPDGFSSIQEINSEKKTYLEDIFFVTPSYKGFLSLRELQKAKSSFDPQNDNVEKHLLFKHLDEWCRKDISLPITLKP